MKHVHIQSNMTIQVTSGLQYDDLTKKDSDIKDRLKIQPKWTRMLIREGSGKYPAEIAEWATVKALEKDGILTVKMIEDDEEEAEVVEEKPVRKRGKAVQDISLAEASKE